MAEGARLESVYTGNRIVGSNPTPSAKCSPDFVAAALLSMLGSVVGARCGIRPKAHDPWFGVPNLWGAIVGQPASKKTPAMNAATRPLDRLIGDVKAALRGDLEAFEYEKMAHEAKAKALKDQLNQSAKNSRGDGPEVFVNRLREHNKAEPSRRNAASRRMILRLRSWES